MVVVVVLDVETSGVKVTENDLIALCYVIYDSELQQTVRANRISFKPRNGENYVFEARCWEEFWLRESNQELLRKFRTEAREIVDGLQKFVADLKHHTGTKDFMIVNDNSAFDVAFVQFYLETYLQEPFHLHYHPNIEQRYIPILDTDSLQVGFQGKKLTGELWGSNAKTFEMKGISPVHRHTHDPLDDAQCILEVLLAITKP